MTDNTGVEKIYSYQERINWHLDRIQAQIKTYTDLIETIAELERKVKGACMVWINANPDCKKIALDKIEMISAKCDEDKENYLYLVYLRHKRSSLEKVIQATESGLSATQSLMKYDRATDYTGGNNA